MTANETAKPCPSSERKKPKVEILKKVLGFASRLYGFYKFVDMCWGWIKESWKAILEQFGDFL